MEFFNFGGLQFPFLPQQSLISTKQEMGGSYLGLIEGAFRANGVVFACMEVRKRLFSEARFQFRELKDGKTGDLFNTPALANLQEPWPNGTTGDLLTRAIQDVDLSGNFYCRRVVEGGIERLRPDWMTIILGSPTGSRIDVELAGYLYQPGGHGSGEEPVILLPDEVAHWAPTPDPAAWYRGMSWLVPIIREILGDSAAMVHKELFFENGATPNMVVSLDPAIQKDVFEAWVAAFQGQTEGLENAYKTLYLGGGAQATVIGKDFKEVDFASTQGHGETRIAAAAGVPPIVVGLSEGLKSATYSNYAQARRAFADATLRPLWRSFCSSMQTIIPTPSNSMLWYDDTDVAFLQEDQADKATIQQTQATTANAYVAAGFDPDSVVKAIQSDDMSLLKHSGLVSVQLLPPGEQKNAPQLGGNGNGKALPAGSKPSKAEPAQT